MNKSLAYWWNYPLVRLTVRRLILRVWRVQITLLIPVGVEKWLPRR